MNGSYLWDRSGPVDPEVERLERVLAPYRCRAESRRPRHRPHTWAAPAAAAACLLASALGLLALEGASDASPYRWTRIAGNARASGDGDGVARGGLRPGDWIETGAGGRARVEVGDIGFVELEEHSRLRVDAAPPLGEDDGYGMHLSVGSLRASIFAAPRLFQVGTPAGVAVDMGCFYRATVEPDGDTRLAVEFGVVQFETADRLAYVPQGAQCLATVADGPGIPCWEDRDEAFRRAAEQRDLDYVLAHAEARDSLTLWHFLLEPDPQVRARALKGLDALRALPDDFAEHGRVLAGDRAAIDRLRETMPWSW